MNAYWGKSNRSIVNRIRNNVYGWMAGGPVENIEYLGGANAGYFEFLQWLVDWVKVNQGLMVPVPTPAASGSPPTSRR
eukprot:13893623-Alexandrium_andersonii.AAC.1